MLLWWAGEVDQLVHKLRRQGVLLVLNPPFAFRWVPQGVIVCVRDCCKGVGRESDDVVSETFHNKVRKMSSINALDILMKSCSF